MQKVRLWVGMGLCLGMWGKVRPAKLDPRTSSSTRKNPYQACLGSVDWGSEVDVDLKARPAPGLLIRTFKARRPNANMLASAGGCSPRVRAHIRTLRSVR